MGYCNLTHSTFRRISVKCTITGTTTTILASFWPFFHRKSGWFQKFYIHFMLYFMFDSKWILFRQVMVSVQKTRCSMNQAQIMNAPNVLGNWNSIYLSFDVNIFFFWMESCVFLLIVHIIYCVHFSILFQNLSRNGQTQSQYLNFGDSQTEGKADAEITRYGSRAFVCE